MNVFGDLKMMLALILVAAVSLFMVESRADSSQPQVASIDSAFSSTLASNHQPAVDDMSKMKVMAEFLASRCGESKPDASFTAEELSTLVLLGESKPHMRSRICSAFTGRRAT